MSEFRKRIMIPAAVALLAAAFLGIIAVSLSRVLLAVPEAGSTILAFLLAGVILMVASTLAAAGSRLKQSQKGLLGVAGIAVLAMGIGGAALGIRDIEVHGTEVEIAAENILFDTDTLTFPADAEVSLVFTNNDEGVPHDVDIYGDDSFSPPQLFDGEVFPGVATTTYLVPPLAEGTYAYRCSIHPGTMTGTLEVGGDGGHGDEPSDEPGGEPHGEETTEPTGEPHAEEPTPTGDAIEIVAEADDTGFRFLAETLTLPADAVFTLRFDNRDDNVPHNVSIYAEAGGENLFRGDIFNGPDVMDYAVGPLAAGTYHFQCDVHPNMSGTATAA